MLTFAEFICREKAICITSMQVAYFEYRKQYEDAPKDILNRYLIEAAKRYGYGLKSVYSNSRKREVVMIRYVAMYQLHKVIGLSSMLVGKMFGRDHSTVLHGCELVKDLLSYQSKDSTECKQLNELFEQIKNNLI